MVATDFKLKVGGYVVITHKQWIKYQLLRYERNRLKAFLKIVQKIKK